MYTIEYDLSETDTFSKLIELIKKAIEENGIEYDYFIMAPISYFPNDTDGHEYEFIYGDLKCKALKVTSLKGEPTIIFSGYIKGVEVRPFNKDEKFKHYKYSTYMGSDIEKHLPDVQMTLPSIIAFERKGDN